MRKSFLFGLLGLTAGMVACQKDITPSEPISGATLTVTVPQGISTRAAADYGQGDNVNRCILEIYHDGQLYGERQIATVAGGQATFSDLRLVASQEYNFIFWADCADGQNDKIYNTTDLSAITVNGDYTGNNDEFDAFYANETFTVTESFSKNVTLTRPFGQLNVKTNDAAAIEKDELKPTHVQVEFVGVPTTFNVFTEEAGQVAPISYTAEVEDFANGELTIDYIWAAAEQSDLVDFTMTFQKDGTTIATNDSFTNIPVRRNYRTNVSGNLITKQGEINVTVDADWADDEISIESMEVSAADLQAKLTSLATNGIVHYTLSLTDQLPANGDYELPALTEGSSITIAMVGAAGQVTFRSETFAGMLTLTDSSATAMDIVIRIPNGDATLGAGNWSAIDVETKPNTLTIAKDAKVTTLSVEGGNVNINQGATVTAVERTATNDDAETIINLFDGASQPAVEGDKIAFQQGVTGQIVNKMTGKSFATIRDAVMAANANDVIEIAEGEYPLDMNVTASDGLKYYLPIEVAGLTLKATGNRDNTILYGREITSNGSINTQNLITVKAANVTIDGFTIMPKVVVNKTIEVTQSGFTLRNCKITPNTYVADEQNNNRGGSVYFTYPTYANGAGEMHATVENNELVKTSVSFDHIYAGTFNVKNNTFDGGNVDYPCMTTPIWGQVDLADLKASKMVVNVENNTFVNVQEYTGSNYAIIRPSYGVFNLVGNSFPTDGIYWQAAAWDSQNTYGNYCDFGAVYVDYNSAVDQYWFKDRTEPKSFAVSNDVIRFETETTPDNNWYAWQGRKAKVNLGAKGSWSVETTLEIPELTRPVRQSVWLNVCDAAGKTVDWAIVGYKIETEGEAGFFETWDSSGEGAWNKVDMASLNLNPGDEAAIKFVFNNGVLTEYVNGIQVNQYTIDGVAVADLSEIIYNSYSYGESYLSTWSYPVVK